MQTIKISIIGLGTSVTWRQEFVEPWFGSCTVRGIRTVQRGNRCHERLKTTGYVIVIAYVQHNGPHCPSPPLLAPCSCYNFPSHSCLQLSAYKHTAHVSCKTAVQGMRFSQGLRWKFQSSGTWCRADWRSNLSGVTFLRAEICALLGYYVALSGSSVPTFRDNLSVSFSSVQVQEENWRPANRLFSSRSETRYNLHQKSTNC
jgi:hypothetical protein